MIDSVLEMFARWQAELVVFGGLLVAIAAVAGIYATLCRLVTWIWRTLGPREVSRGR